MNRARMHRALDRAIDTVRARDAYNDEVTKTFTVTSNSDFMARFEKFLAYVQYCGGVGHSCTIGLGVDGDGAEHPKVKEPLPSIKESDIVTKKEMFEVVKS